MSSPEGTADRELRAALDGRCLVTIDRFTSAGRTCVAGPMRLDAARPAATVGYYQSWSAVGHQRVLAVEDRLRRRDGHAKHRWLEQLGDDVRTLCCSLPSEPVFAAWYADPALLRLAQQCGASVLAVPSAMREALEDKTAFDDLLRSGGVSPRLRIPAITCDRRASFDDVTGRLGGRLVVQPSHTSGGRGTQFVDDQAGFERALVGDGPWRIAAFVEDGSSSNTTVLTVPTADGCAVYVDVPSHKPVGVAALGIAPAKGAGNDWSPPWPQPLVADLVEALVTLGTYLYRVHGLQGLWGADAIWTADRVVINEINVRNQGTTELSGVNQILRGLPPLLIAHLTVLAGGSVSWLPPAAEFNADTIQRAASAGTGPFYIKIRNTAEHPVMPHAAFRGPAVYRFDAAGLSWLRPGAHPMDAALDRGEVLLANVPQAGVLCLPGAELGTVEGITSRPLFAGPSTLSPLGESLHAAVRRLFVRCPWEGDPS